MQAVLRLNVSGHSDPNTPLRAMLCTSAAANVAFGNFVPLFPRRYRFAKDVILSENRVYPQVKILHIPGLYLEDNANIPDIAGIDGDKVMIH